MQLIGRPFEEDLLLRLAHAYQQATDHHLRAPAL
jgi:Asp-tRNA(Asn)/Glu-tRNA(Gln) amidotransferase A subunit family amidase